MKLTICLFLCFVSFAMADAERARSAFEAIIRKDGFVQIAATAPTWSLQTPMEERPDAIQTKQRQDKFKNDWPDFLRRFTEEPPAAKSGATQPGRVLKSNVFWREFFSGSSSDDVMRAADTWTAALLISLNARRPGVELEMDGAKRSRMLGRIDRAKKDLTDWCKNGRDARRARQMLGGSLVELIAPL